MNDRHWADATRLRIRCDVAHKKTLTGQSCEGDGQANQIRLFLLELEQLLQLAVQVRQLVELVLLQQLLVLLP